MHLVINGFGRIGRTVLRQLLAAEADKKPRSIWVNDIAPLETCVYLFKYDSVFGPYPGDVRCEAGEIVVDGTTIRFSNASDLSTLDLSGVDLVMECTGKVSTREFAERGLKAGAKNILVSGPASAADVTIVIGANEQELGLHRIVSNASCTTNALAPLLKVIEERIGIEVGHMTTIHCYTGSQPMVDAPRETMERSRAGGVSMVPTTTSATKLVFDVLPHLKGRISGAAVRVPAISVSAVDLTLTLKERTPVDFNDQLCTLFEGNPVIGFVNEAVVSTDMRARPESLVIALPETLTTGERQVRIFGWYDNEWGFATRMIEMAHLMVSR